MALGFTLALLSMILFGLYMVPRKFCHLRHLEFVLSMAVGVIATMAAAWGLRRAAGPLPLPGDAVAYAFLCGPIWTLGMVAFTCAVAEMGLTLATPVKNTTAVMGTLVGLLFFGETRQTIAWMALSGSALIVLCAVAIGRAGEDSEIHFPVTGPGIAYSLLAAFFFAAYTFPLKAAMTHGLDFYSIGLVMAAGIVISAAVGNILQGGSIARWWRQPRADHLHGALAGAIWSVATLFMNDAIVRIGLAVTWPITNLNTVVAVAIGALAFREVRLEKQWPRLAQGIVFAALGVALLGLSKT